MQSINKKEIHSAKPLCLSSKPTKEASVVKVSCECENEADRNKVIGCGVWN